VVKSVLFGVFFQNHTRKLRRR